MLLYLLALNGATWQAYKRGERRARQFLIATGFLLLAIVGELILLLLPFETFINALVFNIGVLAFGIILFSQIVKQIIRFFKQRGKEEYLATLVYTDELTTLSNRRAFDEYLNQLRKPQTHLDGIGIAIFDVNDLKKVNDEEGHAAGDRLLKETASLLKTLYGEIGTLYRIGGDEFALICTSSTLDTLKEIESLLLGKNLNVACGSALYEKGITTSIDNLFEKADKRMYTYKHRMKHPYGVSRGQ